MCQKISIIIPCYNVEHYIAKCLDSVINQTYANLEIICIDDGSTDKTAELLDLFGEQDERIRVIHQNNCGLAEVRNIGKELAQGEYLYYLDSDDYIEYETLEMMMQALQEKEADMVISGFYIEYVDGKKVRNNKKNVRMCMNSQEAQGLYLYTGYVNPVAWAKLYKRNLLSDVEYPSGRIYEDMATTYKIIEKARLIYYDSYPYYHYIQRNSSIGKIADKKLNKQLEEAVESYWNHIKNNTFISRQTQAGCSFWYLVAYNRIICAGENDFELIKKIRYQATGTEIIKCRYISFRKKAQLLLFKASPFVYGEIYRKFAVSKAKRMLK